VRIVGGELAGRTLPGKPPEGTRPTADRVREAVASALQARSLLEGAEVLDLYAGTGALGFEALSWGARSVLAIDSSSAALRCIHDNARALGVLDRHETHKLDLSARAVKRAAQRIAALRRAREGFAGFTLVLADPPYADALALPALLEELAQAGCLHDQAAALLEHPHKTQLPAPAGFNEIARYRYGDTAILLACRAADVAAADVAP
jgi:16S rRNA (guanine966-N2)-methyltransferase